MSNVITVFSAITDSAVASVNTETTRIDEAISMALSFPEISSASFEVRADLENALRNAYAATTDQEIRSANLAAVHISHVTVSVGVTAEDAPAEVVEPVAPEGVNVVVNSAVLNAPLGEFNTADETLESLSDAAMEYPEVSGSSVSTQIALKALATEVLANTEDKTWSNDLLSSVGIASVVAGNGTPEVDSVPTEDTPVYAALVAGEPTVKAGEPTVIYKTEYRDVPGTHTVKTVGLPNWVTVAIGAVALVVGAVVGGGIF